MPSQLRCGGGLEIPMPDVTVFDLPGEPSFTDIQRWEDDGGAVPLELFSARRRFAHRRPEFDADNEQVRVAALGALIFAD